MFSAIGSNKQQPTAANSTSKVDGDGGDQDFGMYAAFSIKHIIIQYFNLICRKLTCDCTVSHTGKMMQDAAPLASQAGIGSILGYSVGFAARRAGQRLLIVAGCVIASAQVCCGGDDGGGRTVIT